MRTTSLSIGQTIYKALSTVLPNVYPVLIPAGTTPPSVVYRRLSFEVQGDKDNGEDTEVVTIVFVCIAQDYAESVELAEKVANVVQALERVEGAEIERVRLVDSAEDFEEEGLLYIQSLTYEITAE